MLTQERPPFQDINDSAPSMEFKMSSSLSKLRIHVPALRLPSMESSPVSAAKPTRSERRLAAQSKGSFSISTPVKSPLNLKPMAATPLDSQRSEDHYEVPCSASHFQQCHSLHWRIKYSGMAPLLRIERVVGAALTRMMHCDV